jgi:membrane associated rhomboid family serine protease
MPRVIAALIAVVAICSIAAAVGARNGAAFLAEGGVLVGARVWHGEIWRLVTWVLFELSPIGLLFACLTLYWFGRDLVYAWGEKRFLAFYFGVAAAAGAVTCLVGLVWPVVAVFPYAGSWAALDGMLVAWGLMNAKRELHLFGLVRLTGRHLVWLTLGLTALYALFSGVAPFVPHLAAALLVFAWRGPLRDLPGWWKRRRQATVAQRARVFDLQEWVKRDRRRN